MSEVTATSGDRGASGEGSAPPAPARDEILRDVVYAQAILAEAVKANETCGRRSASWLSGAGKLLGNGLVLLLVGALISNWLVPRLQRQQQERQTRLAARKDVLAQFLLYANVRWQEYYLLPPLAAHPELTRPEYDQAVRELTRTKIARYDAFAKIEALAIAFRRTPGERNAVLEGALENYAIRINQFSQEIDAWLRNAYCYSNECNDDPAAPLDPDFDSYAAFVKIQREAVELLKLDASVAALISANLMED